MSSKKTKYWECVNTRKALKDYKSASVMITDYNKVKTLLKKGGRIIKAHK